MKQASAFVSIQLITFVLAVDPFRPSVCTPKGGVCGLSKRPVLVLTFSLPFSKLDVVSSL